MYLLNVFMLVRSHLGSSSWPILAHLGSFSSRASMAKVKKEVVKGAAAKARVVKKAVAALPKAAVAKAKGKQTSSSRSNSAIVDKGEFKKTRNLDLTVLRAIQTRYPGIDEPSLYGTIVDGMSLFDYVKAKKVAAALKGAYLEEDMWDGLKTTFSISVASPVMVKDKSETVDPLLVHALAACRTQDMNVRTRASLCGWFAKAKELNQRSLVGIVSNLSKLHAGASANSAHVCLSFLKMAKSCLCTLLSQMIF